MNEAIDSQPAVGESFTSSSPIFSMTGFSTAQSATDDGIGFTLTLKSVNHRFLDLNLRVPSDCDGLEIALRRLIKERVRRGHVDVSLFVDRQSKEVSAVQINHDLLGTHLAALKEIASRHAIPFEPNLNDLLRVPGVLSNDNASSSDNTRGAALEAAALRIAPSLIEQLNQVRATEGNALAIELRASMHKIHRLVEEAAEIRVSAREAHFTRLRSRLTELLGDLQEAPPDLATDQRLLSEAALLAERSDVEEELVRLRAHTENFLDMLAAGGELGKRLDFLLQEMNREANTLLSKSSSGDPNLGLRVTSLGLELKAEIERAREQVQNLE